MTSRHAAHPRFVHLNGAIIPASQARISPFDRGFLFGDGVYEGLRAFAGRVVALEAHERRMQAGLDATRITGFDPGVIGDICAQLLAAERLEDAFIYVQVSRGAPSADAPARSRDRDALAGLAPTVLGFATPQPALEAHRAPAAKRVSLRPDVRWQRGEVKSISLLGAVLAGLEAQEADADDAILARDGLVTEAQSANVCVVKAGAVATPALSSAPLLAGVTRGLLLRADPTIAQRPVRVEELRDADEIVLVGTTTMVTSVTHLDGVPVGGQRGARPGPVAHHLLRTLVDAIRTDIDAPFASSSSRSAVH